REELPAKQRIISEARGLQQRQGVVLAQGLLRRDAGVVGGVLALGIRTAGSRSLTAQGYRAGTELLERHRLGALDRALLGARASVAFRITAAARCGQQRGGERGPEERAKQAGEVFHGCRRC